LAFGSLVTISNCGASASDNVCGAGTITKKEAAGWNNRVWDTKECCHNCACRGARWKIPASAHGLHVYCGFSAWNAAGSTNKDGNHAFSTYGLHYVGHMSHRLYYGKGGPDTGYTEGPVVHSGSYVAGNTAKYIEVQLTSTGADLKYDGTTIYTVNQAPSDSKYRFGCALKVPNAGISDLAYYEITGGSSAASPAPPLPPLTHNHDIFVASGGSDAVIQYHNTTGAFKAKFTDKEVSSAHGLVFGTDWGSHFLYATGPFAGAIVKFDRNNGTYVEHFTDRDLKRPTGIVYHNKKLFVLDGSTIRTYDAETGEFLEVFTNKDGMDASFLVFHDM